MPSPLTWASTKGMRDHDICGVGELDVDIYLRVPKLPLPSEKTRGEDVELHPGGMVANFLVRAQRYGMRTAYQGRVGTDRFGEVALAALQAEGVDISRARQLEDEPTFFALVMHDGQGDKQLVTAVTACKDFDAEDVDLDLLAACRHVHSNLTEQTGWLAAAARERGCSVSVDFDELPGTELPPWLTNVDLLFLAERSDADQRSPATIAAVLAAGPSMVVTTRGAAGAAVHHLRDGELIVTEVGTPRVDVVDTTGAGDCFAAWFVSGLLDGRDLETSLQQASVAASLSTQDRGAWTALLSQSDVAEQAPDLRVRTYRHPL